MRCEQYCRIHYWRNDGECIVACGPEDKWDFCEVLPLSSYSSYGAQRFERGEDFKRGALIYLLQQAFEAGQANKLREIQRILGIGK